MTIFQIIFLVFLLFANCLIWWAVIIYREIEYGHLKVKWMRPEWTYNRRWIWGFGHGL